MSVDSAAVAAVTGFVRALPLQLFDAPDARSLALLRRHALFRRPVTLPSTQGASAVFLQAVSVSPVLISVTTHINARMALGGSLGGSLLPGVAAFTPVEALLDSLGGFLGTVDNAQLTLDRFAARNLLLSRPALGRALSAHYAKQALLQLYRVVGSISVLGNPVGLLQSVGSGMRDFFLEPFRGLGSGGEGFVTGVGRGALSLLQNASYGMLNSVGRIASSIGDGLCLMTLSDDFAANRSAGRNGFVYGVKEGVLGLFRDTVDGAMKNGLVGALAGTGRGLVGLVAKPATGLLDDTSYVIDSLKDAAQPAATAQRVRLARFVYPDGVLTPFCAYLARGQAFFQRCSALSCFDPRDAYQVHVADCRGDVLLLTQQRAVLLHPEGTLAWAVEYAGVESVTTEFNVLAIKCYGERRTVVLPSCAIATSVLLLLEGYKAGGRFDASPLIRSIAVHFGEREDDEAPQGVEAIPPFLRSAVVVSATVMSCHLCSSNNDRSASNADGNASNADGKEMSEFVVRVCSKTGTWDVHRRYADFL